MGRAKGDIAASANSVRRGDAGLVLLGRDAFRESTFARDGHKCVVCGASAKDGAKLDAHHIMERRLFDNGGYFLDNSVTLCDDGERHHLKAEQTLITPDELRALAGITNVVLPEGLDDDLRYDKWGNAYLPGGNRAPGPLFYEEPVQKVLKDGKVMNEFEKRFKHPRTIHLPWSANRGADGDHAHTDTHSFDGHEVVVTLKMDGENTTMSRDHVHARSLDSGYHNTRTWVNALHGRVRYDIPEGWRVVGENMYGVHSIKYDTLPSYFLVFSIFTEKNECLSWEETVEYAQLLGLDTVPVLYRGQWDEKKVQALEPPPLYGEDAEGYVVRWSEQFSYYQWHLAVGKSVRKGHVKEDSGHWRTSFVPANGVIKED